MGWRRRSASYVAAGSSVAATSRCTQGLSTVPGEMQLTRMPYGTSSAAIALVSAWTAPFELA